MTAKTWNPPPKMPADLPPLPMGMNGRPLVCLGVGQSFEVPSIGFEGFMISAEGSWGKDIWNGQSEDCHYAAESDSEVCRLNGWGDFTPEAQKEPVKAGPAKSAVERHLEQLRAEERDAEKDFMDADKAFDEALERRCQKMSAWNDKLEIIYKLEGQDDALTRRAWYLAGRKDERHRAKVRTNFPLYP